MSAPTGPLTVLIASFLEPEYVEQIARVDGIRVIYEPLLLPTTRYMCDHVGIPLTRTPDDEQRWRQYLAQADVMFDFDHTNAGLLKTLIPRVRW
ncbi:MAG: D-2-hydroxyacid dehydrogenase, partial [Armatimonadota bacterium]